MIPEIRIRQPETLCTAFLVYLPDVPHVLAHNHALLLLRQFLSDYAVDLKEKGVFFGLVGIIDECRVDFELGTARGQLDPA